MGKRDKRKGKILEVFLERHFVLYYQREGLLVKTRKLSFVPTISSKTFLLKNSVEGAVYGYVVKKGVLYTLFRSTSIQVREVR